MTQSFNDEILIAYLEGRMPDADRDRLEKLVEGDPVLAAHLQSLDLPAQDIAAALQTLLDDAPAIRVELLASTKPLASGRLALAACLVLGILVGVVAPRAFVSDPQTDWKLAVATYQSLYVSETLSDEPASPTDVATRLTSLEKTLGRTLDFALNSGDLGFRRAQLLGIAGKPLVQIAYLSAKGAPVALCITPVDNADYSATDQRLHGLAATHWVKDGYGFLLIGGDDSPEIAAMARRFELES